MRSALTVVELLVALAAAAGVAGGSALVPSRVMATGTEFELSLSRTKIKPGWAIVQFVNSGEDAHDLKVQRLGGVREHAIGELPSGGLGEVRLFLQRGQRYQLWCSLSEHRTWGMEATLRVRRHW